MKETTLLQITSIIIIVVGLLINYAIAKRRFNRRSITGMQQFKTFEGAWSITLVEKPLRMLAKGLMTIGALTFLLTFM